MCIAFDASLAETIEPAFMETGPAARECFPVATLSEWPSLLQAPASSAPAELRRIAYRGAVHMRAIHKQAGIAASA